jgi:excisionase family DNA binding protein
MTGIPELNAKLDALTAIIERLEKRMFAPAAEMLTPAEAARALSVSTKTLARMVKRGALHVVYLDGRGGKKAWRVPAAELRRYATPKVKAPPPSRQRKASQPYDARTEAEAIRRANGGRR